MSRAIHALRIVKVTNRMLDRRFWKPGAYLKLTLACEQEPALGFGNFDSWDPVPLTEATFYERPLDAARQLPDVDRMGGRGRDRRVHRDGHVQPRSGGVAMTRKAKAAVPAPKTPSPAEAHLFEGALVKHVNRHNGFGVAKGRGIVRGFIEPEPGWHRALVAWDDEDGQGATEQYVDTDKLEMDAIGTLGKLVEDAGCQMTLFGQPVTTEQLRTAATESALDRIENALNPNGIRLGQIVHLRGFAKGEDRAHVVVAEPSAGRVKLAYCGTERWYVAKWYAVEFLITELKDNHHVRRARRWLDKAEVGPGGWKRILCGPWAGGEWETVGHVDIQPAASSP